MREVEESAAEHMVAAAARWLETRQVCAYPARPHWVAEHLVEYLWPYMLVQAYAHMADSMRAAGVDDVANTLEQVQQTYVTNLVRRSDDG